MGFQNYQFFWLQFLSGVKIDNSESLNASPQSNKAATLDEKQNEMVEEFFKNPSTKRYPRKHKQLSGYLKKKNSKNTSKNENNQINVFTAEPPKACLTIIQSLGVGEA